jgi:hypothetical protein
MTGQWQFRVEGSTPSREPETSGRNHNLPGRIAQEERDCAGRKTAEGLRAE